MAGLFRSEYLFRIQNPIRVEDLFRTAYQVEVLLRDQMYARPFSEAVSTFGQNLFIFVSMYCRGIGRFKAVAVGLLLLGPLFLSAQQESYLSHARQLTVKDGLPNNTTGRGLQDSRGFVWIPTTNGLARYDGENFRILTSDHGLRENYVQVMAEDANGFLWLVYGTRGANHTKFGALDLIDVNTLEVLNVRDVYPQVAEVASKVVTVFSDSHGTMFLSTSEDELYRVRDGRPQFFSPHTCHLFLRRTLFNFVGDEHIWICMSDREMLGLNAQGDTIGLVRLPDKNVIVPIGLDGNEQLLFFLSNEGDLEAGTLNAGMYRSTSYGGYEQVTDVFSSDESQNYHSTFLYYDHPRKRSLIFTDDAGWFLVDKDAHVHRVEKEDGIDIGGASISIPLGCADRSGRIWAFTDLQGAFLIELRPHRFRTLLTIDQFDVKGWESCQARGMAEDSKGNIYVSHWAGVHKVDLSSADVRHWSDQEWVNGLVSYNDGWLLMVDDVFHLNEAGDIRSIYPLAHSDNVADNVTWSLFADSEEHVWAGNRDGVRFLDHGSASFMPVEVRNAAGSVCHPTVYQLLELSTGELLAVSDQGIFSANRSSDPRNTLFKEVDMGVEKDVFFMLHPQNDSIFWIATDGYGLLRWNRASNSIEKRWTMADGLPSNVLYGILEHEDKLWISSDNGLIRFDPNTSGLVNYGMKDGLPHTEFNRQSYFKNSTGRMFFGGLNGVVHFNPDDFENDSVYFDTPLAITSYQKFNGSTEKLEDLTDVLGASGNIILSPGDRFFSIQFQLLDFSEDKRHYAYMVEGFDTDWNYTDQNSVRFSGLPYGSYVLRVKGQNALGHWSTNELRIPIEVVVPIYLRTWFLALAFVLGVVSVLLFIRYRTARLKKRAKELERTVAERTAELDVSIKQKETLLKEIHHRVKNNLQVISSLLELQSNRLSDEVSQSAFQEGQNRVRSIALIHQLLYQGEDLAAVEFTEFVRLLFNQVRSVMTTAGIQVELELKAAETTFDIDTAVPLGLIINEMLTNSFKYVFQQGAQHVVVIELEPAGDGKFQLTYHDGGPGIPPEVEIQKAKTLGLRLIYRLTKQLGGSVRVNAPEGHLFEIVFLTQEARKEIN